MQIKHIYCMMILKYLPQWEEYMKNFCSIQKFIYTQKAILNSF